MKPNGGSEDLVRFADEIGLFYEGFGLPRACGRVLGWLLVCEPDFQTAEDLTRALHVSRGAVSMATRMLVRNGMVERRTMPGDRRIYHGISPEAFVTIFEQQGRTATRLRKLADEGLALLEGESPERRRRLQEMRHLTAFYEREAPALLQRWYRERQNL